MLHLQLRVYEQKEDNKKQIKTKMAEAKNF